MTKQTKKITNKDLDKFVTKELKDTTHEKDSFLFKNKNIGVSISDSPEISSLGFSVEHQKNLIIEITRYLVIHGSRLIYGGDLRVNGYTRLFSDLVHQYRPSNEVNDVFFKNFFCFPVYLGLKQSDLLDFTKNSVEPVKVKPPNYLDIDESKFLEPNTPENLFVWAECLTKMRREMNAITDARIFTGGAIENFKGKCPGLLEEAILSLDKNIPVYFIGLFGGITDRIFQGLEGKKPKELTIDWQIGQNKIYKEFVTYYNQKTKEQKIDYNTYTEYLNEYTLHRLSENNGLTIEENKRLFNSIHTSEIIFLIMKGLSKKLN